MTKEVPEQLQEYYDAECPDDFWGFWQDFLDLCNRRSYTEAGPSTLTYSEIYSWKRLTNSDIKEYGLYMIEMLDDLWLDEHVKNSKKNSKKG